jgi:hypothetical protein
MPQCRRAAHVQYQNCFSTVRLLVTSTGRWTTELLWFATTRISNKKSAVVFLKNLLDLILGRLINIFEKGDKKEAKGDNNKEGGRATREIQNETRPSFSGLNKNFSYISV